MQSSKTSPVFQQDSWFSRVLSPPCCQGQRAHSLGNCLTSFLSCRISLGMYCRAGGLPPPTRCVHLWRTLNGEIIDTVCTRRGAHAVKPYAHCHFGRIHTNSRNFSFIVLRKSRNLTGAQWAPLRIKRDIIPFNQPRNHRYPGGGGKPAPYEALMK